MNGRDSPEEAVARDRSRDATDPKAHESGVGLSRQSTGTAVIQGPRGFVARNGWNVIGLPIVIVAMILYFASQSPNFLSTSNYQNVALNLSPIALLAIGEAFVILLAQVDISVGSIVGLTTVTTAMAMGSFGVLGFAAAPLTGAAVGLVNGTIVAKFRVHSVIVTIGTLTAARGLAYVLTNGEPVTGNFPSAFTWLGTGSVGVFPAPFVIAVLALLLAGLLLRYTIYGTSLYATGGNEEASRLAGISVDRVKIIAFVITGTLAGIAGLIFAARINSGQPNLGEGLELTAIASAVVGGMSLVGGKGSIIGVTLGILVLGILQNGLDITNVSSYTQQVVSGIVILIAVILDSFRSRSPLSFLNRRVSASEASNHGSTEVPPHGD